MNKLYEGLGSSLEVIRVFPEWCLGNEDGDEFWQSYEVRTGRVRIRRSHR